jgi:hypothetical protein
MKRRILKSSRAWVVVLALGGGVIGSLAMASPSVAQVPLSGSNCQASSSGTAATEGKISGRGSSLQTFAVFNVIQQFENDECGAVPSDNATNTYSSANFPSCTSGGTQVTGEPTGDPTDPSTPIDSFGNCPNTPSPFPTYGGDGMVAYNYPAAEDNSGTGSTQGKMTMSCRTDAFSGTDLPYGDADWGNGGAANGMTGPLGSEGTVAGKTCEPTLSQGGVVSHPDAFISPFQTWGNTSATENPNDTTTNEWANDSTSASLMSFPIAASAVAVATNLPAACYLNATTGLELDNNDILAIWSGDVTTWTSLPDLTFPDDVNLTAANGCSIAITRVVRQDTSGTTQGFLNYLNDVAVADPTGDGGASGTANCSATNGTANTATMNELDQNAGLASPENTKWPSGGTTCSAVTNNANSGGPALLSTLAGTSGGVGYADVSDENNDPGDAAHLQSALLETSTGTFAGPKNGTASNCTFANGFPVSPTGAQWVGIGTADSGGSDGYWGLDYGDPQFATAKTGVNTADNIGYSAQGADYPACSLTWDFVWGGENGNLQAHAAATTTLNATSQTLTLSAAPPAGTPTSGSLIIGATSTSNGTEYKYSGLSGATLTVNVGTATVHVFTSTNIALPGVPGAGSGLTNKGPESELNTNQRQTLYSFMSYMLSDEAQSALTANGYAGLPEPAIQSIRQEFQSTY